jgi:hypothetical protein
MHHLKESAKVRFLFNFFYNYFYATVVDDWVSICRHLQKFCF